MATFHPAYIIRQQEDRTIFQTDLRRAAREAKSPEYTYRPPALLIRPDYQTVVYALRDILREKPHIAFDIETFGPHVRCLGIAWRRLDKSPTAICIPFYKRKEIKFDAAQLQKVSVGSIGLIESSLHDQQGRSENYWSFDDEVTIVGLLGEIFHDLNIPKIGQNLQYDVLTLAHEFGFVFDGLYMDTMKAQHSCYAELPKGLDFLGSIYTDHPYWSDFNHDSDEEWWTYNAMDCVVTLECADALKSELKRLNLDEVYFFHDQPHLEAMMCIQTNGLLVNKEARAQKLVESKALRESLQKKCAELTGIPDFNPNSHTQMKQYLYKTLGLQPHYKQTPDGRRETADVHALEDLKRDNPQYAEFIDTALGYREQSKLIGTYLEVPLSHDSRIYTSYNPAGTVTRRLSSSEFGYALQGRYPSTNLQNVPRTDFRRFFVAPGDDWWMLKADLSQAEFRIVVWLAKIDRLIERYVHDHPYIEEPPGHKRFDVHRWVASLIFRISEDLITKDQRSLAKNGVYGGNYAMEAKRASQVYGLTLPMAQFILASYRRALHEIPSWWKEVEQTLRATRTIKSPLGPHRIFFGKLDDETFRGAYSHSAQSIVADLINRATTILFHTLPPEMAFIVAQVHDELDFYCRKSMLDRVAPVIINSMQYPLYFPGVVPPLIIPAEVSYGPNWYDQKLWEDNGRSKQLIADAESGDSGLTIPEISRVSTTTSIKLLDRLP
jgi:DNA polymerase I-like protein with 3'-5' exonuclease and polymerase domains